MKRPNAIVLELGVLAYFLSVGGLYWGLRLWLASARARQNR